MFRWNSSSIVKRRWKADHWSLCELCTKEKYSCNFLIIKIPSLINRYLRDYQRKGVEFLYDHYSRNEGALLADDMGLGKTVQVIAFLAAIQRKTGTNVDLLRMKPSILRKVSWKLIEFLTEIYFSNKVFCSQLDEEEGLVAPSNDELDDYSRKPSLIVAPACVLCNWIQELSVWGHFSVG